MSPGSFEHSRGQQPPWSLRCAHLVHLHTTMKSSTLRMHNVERDAPATCPRVCWSFCLSTKLGSGDRMAGPKCGSGVDAPTNGTREMIWGNRDVGNPRRPSMWVVSESPRCSLSPALHSVRKSEDPGPTIGQDIPWSGTWFEWCPGHGVWLVSRDRLTRGLAAEEIGLVSDAGSATLILPIAQTAVLLPRQPQELPSSVDTEEQDMPGTRCEQIWRRVWISKEKHVGNPVVVPSPGGSILTKEPKTHESMKITTKSPATTTLLTFLYFFPRPEFLF